MWRGKGRFQDVENKEPLNTKVLPHFTKNTEIKVWINKPNYVHWPSCFAQNRSVYWMRNLVWFSVKLIYKYQNLQVFIYLWRLAEHVNKTLYVLLLELMRGAQVKLLFLNYNHHWLWYLILINRIFNSMFILVNQSTEFKSVLTI